MTSAQSGGVPAAGRGEHERLEKWMSAAAALAVGGAFFALLFWLLPGWLGFRVETAGRAGGRWAGAIRSRPGFAGSMARRLGSGCTGRGGPTPFAPPRPFVGGGRARSRRDR